MTTNISKFVKNLTDINDYKLFAEEQFKTIQKLTRENKELENKILHLETLLASATMPVIGDNLLAEAKDKIIAEVQLNKLNEISLGRELTKEEAQKVEIYARILSEHRKTDKKTISVDASKVDDAVLLQAVASDGQVK